MRLAQQLATGGNALLLSGEAEDPFAGRVSEWERSVRLSRAFTHRLLRLALTLAATRTGLTLDEIAAEMEVGRRTAERLRDALAGLFPRLEGWDDEARVRRWRLPGAALAGVAEPRAEAVAAVEALARECATRGEADRAGLLREAATTLRALMRPASLRRAEPDIAALMEAEGIAMRPGPRPGLARNCTDPAPMPNEEAPLRDRAREYRA